MKNLISDIKSGRFRHVYLLTGEETYLRLQYRDRLIAALMGDENAMNLTTFRGRGTDENEIISQGETLPFFAERRVIRIENTGFFTRTAERLPDYLGEIPDYLYLVFNEDETDRRNRLYKAVAKYGAVAEFSRQTDATLEKWILTMLKPANLSIRKANMDELLTRTGPDMTHIRLEVDKLIHYCMEMHPAADGAESAPVEITREDIEAVTTDQTENRIFDMMSAITRRRRREAMALYSDLLALREPPLRILILLGQQFNRLLLIHDLDSEGNGPQQIASRAGIPPFAVRRSLPLARSYPVSQLKAALRACNDMDAAIKAGTMQDRLAVELLIMKLSAPGDRPDGA